MSTDARSWHVALVPDALLNPAEGGAGTPDALRVLEAQGYGLLQLPPPDGLGDPGLLLAVIADQVAEYAHHGYAVVAVGLRGEPDDGLYWRRLVALLRHRGVAAPPRHVYDPGHDAATEEQRLVRFLAAHDIPDEDQRVWRH